MLFECEYVSMHVYTIIVCLSSDPSKRGGNAGHGRSIASDRKLHERSTAVIAASE